MLIATGVMTCASMAPAMAATNVDSNANVTVKKGATVTVAENATVTVGDNAIALGKGAYAVKNSIAIGNGAYTQDGSLTKGQSVALGNGAVTGAKSTSIGSNAVGGREGTITIGANANNGSAYATVIGTDSKLMYKTKYSGAAATIVGAQSEIKNENDNQEYSGVANGIYGSANTIKNSNGVTIQGSGNTVTDAYKDMNIGFLDGLAILGGDYSVLAKKESGAVAVVGGANTVSKQTDSTVIGYANKLTSDKEKGSQNVFMAGSHNTLTNVSDSLVMGNDNTISDRSNVISFGYKNAITANNAVAIGNGASVSSEGGVALGAGSVADRANAVSVGSKDANRQIINVAEGKADTDAVNVSQLKDVKAEALKHSTVTNGANITVTEGLNKDGGKEYNVALNNDIHLFGDNDAMVSISGSKGTIWTSGSVTAGSVAVGTAKADGTTPFFVDSNGAFYAADSKFSVDKDGNANANSVQTNALNAKYNLSVGTANENGTVPFFVNSNGAFYAANGKLVVDKDGKVTATEGEIGNVVLKNGVLYKNTALRDGELYVGDADGNYSQITPKSAKLGQVTIDEQGNIAGVNSIQTNALNAKYNLSVGTANENGIMPFFVNSNGAFYGANNNFSVDKDGKVTATAGEIGNVVLQNGVFTGHSALRDGELFVGDASGNYSQITTKGAKLGKVTVAADGKISGVAAGAVTADSTDAVNGSQLHAVATEASKHSKVVNGSNINVEETDLDGQKVYKVNLNKDIMLGDLTGKYVSISGTNGTIETTGAIATKDRVYADKGAKLADIDVTGNTISNGDAKLALNGAAGTAGIINGQGASVYMQGSTTLINQKVSVDKNGKISGVAAGEVSSTSTDAINGSQLHQTNENVAALDKRVTQNEADIATNKANIAQNAADIAQNKADIAANRADIDKNKADIAQNKADIAQNKADIAQNKTDIKNLDNRVTNVEELAKKHTTVTAGDNITVAETTNKDGGKEYKVALDKDITLDSVTTGQTVMNNDGLKVGDKVSVTKDAVTAGKTSISDEGVKVGDKTYISDKGLNANGQQITNVADGKENGDAVNYGQLKGVENQVVSNTNRINQLGSRVNKVGAGAAALAALHPMDFDPDDKLTFSAGYGNYGGENAAAIGAYYRPDEKVMFSVGGTVGNGENMVNAGVSFSLDRTNHVSNSRTAMAREILDLRAEVTELKAMVAKGGLGSIAEDKMKIFPDVAENHWAYEYVGKLAAAGIIEGYPDGNFSGDRMMSRYEFAAMLYRAMQKGAQLDSKIINEFAPEMGRIRVDRISGEDGDRDKIERVRVNAVKGERDHYGNKIAKAEAKAK
ncbi:YadA-like family protein [Phascolarctobacterium succinatutens]|uniref:SLH domain-containing protein n=1 Tax=Phascolarctobacterium succinatutens TaxID=626940 RepID=A0A1Q6R4X7_9FIRM|nr:YadA-like family protein [Phascolarctobacterium succinatutens]OLA37413.1 MAG: hypothetical protein BHW43_06190 [Phascolarctobacterium succinatutens]